MRIIDRRLTTILCLAVLTLMLLTPPATAQTPAAKVAIANPARIFNEIQETKDLKAKMESDRKTLEATELEKRTQLRDLTAQRDALKPDSQAYAELNQRLLQASIEFEVWGRMQQAEVQRRQKQQMVALFNKITAAVAKVATQQGIDLVIAEQRPEIPDNLDPVDINVLRNLINQRNVLFNSPAVDLSDKVIAAMDADYKAGK
ncbi:OmpH family outer membrane protein [Fontivita pretiosa]|uniref:OmpH family outer membrane protein n=1 Tax=Fontivita pretiosa TaxID=2989684 RepID=UPI003D186E1A